MSSKISLPGLHNLSIKRKLMLIIMAASTVALLLISGAFVTYELFTFRQGMTRDLSTLAEIIGNQSTAALTFNENTAAEETLSALSAQRHIVSACIYKGGEAFARYPRTIRPENVPPARPEAEGFRFEQDHLILFHPVVLNGEAIGTVYLKSDLLELHERLWRYAGIIFLFILLSSVITFLLSAVLQRIISRPIFHLAETAKAVSAERNYSLRAVKQSEDELGQLMDGFNEMLAQIQERDAALQQAQSKLEKRVEERTRDLQGEIAEREQAQKALQQQLTRISLLTQITQVVSERQDLSRILHVVLRQLEDHLPVSLGMMCLYEPESDQVRVAALREKNAKQADKLDLAQGGRMGLVEAGLASCKQGKTVYLADTSAAETGLPRRLALTGIDCMVAVPLTVEEKLFGILVVGRAGVDSFSSGECEFLRMLSDHVALAAHQARLHSELESAYNELRQTQQAVMQQDRLRALGQMASGIAHDINNALSPVVGFAELLLQYEPNLSQSAKKQLNYIRTAGGDVAHIVARLREFYRRRDECEPLLTLNLDRLVEQVIDMTRPRWRDIPQGKGIMVEMQCELAPGFPPVVGIESELREALTNVILNAVDAMPSGGKLSVRTRLGGPGYNGTNNPTHGILEVGDTGIGMDEETRRRCLEPFFSTKGKRGTGMGLPMVYGVMERHEGRIEIDSELGKGTTVRLVFPLGENAGDSLNTPVESAAPAPLHILCIDDEPLLRELLKELLESDGHTVQVADGGQTGLHAFRQASERNRSFDIVITDLGMPFLDGRQVAKAIKSESPATSVIMLTGWGAFMKADGDVPVDVDGILSKPPRARELREALTRLTRK
jgi:signal transduction histidine kinase/ActR/RegA family two-component response regulator/HAMP domain-containing protein